MVHGDNLYLVNDMQSILTVFEAKTGTLIYQDRLGQALKESFSASPVAVGDKLFFTNDEGQTFVVQAGNTFKLLHVNELKARVIASPALVDGVWYWRTDRSGAACRFSNGSAVDRVPLDVPFYDLPIVTWVLGGALLAILLLARWKRR